MSSSDTLTIRELGGLDELVLTPPLARSIWGEDDQPEDPVLLLTVQRTGGLIAGAVDEDGQLWAYLVGLPHDWPASEAFPAGGTRRTARRSLR